MSEGCRYCGFYAAAGWPHCAWCGQVPKPSLACLIGIESCLVFLAVVGLVGIAVDREDSFFMGWTMLLSSGFGILLFAYGFTKALSRYAMESNLETQ